MEMMAPPKPRTMIEMDGRSSAKTKKASQGAHDGGQQGEQADQGPWKSQQEQQGNAQGGEENGLLHVGPHDHFIIQGGPVGPHRRQPDLQALGGKTRLQFFTQLIHISGQCAGKGAVRARSYGHGGQQHMAAIAGEQMTFIYPRRLGRGHMDQLGQDNILEAQWVLGHDGGLTDAVHLEQPLLHRLHPAGDIFRSEQRPDPFFQFPGREQNRQTIHYRPHHLGQAFGHILHAHALEQPAASQGLLHRPSTCHQQIRIVVVQPHVNGQLVLERVVLENVHGIANHRIVLGQGGDNIGIDADMLPADGEQTGGGHEDEEQQRQIGAGRFHFRLFTLESFSSHQTSHSSTTKPTRCNVTSAVLCRCHHSLTFWMRRNPPHQRLKVSRLRWRRLSEAVSPWKAKDG